MAASVDFKTYVDQACRAADEFVNIYYETMDKRRRALTRLYLDKATLVWNGNAVSGQEELNKFFEMLPSSEFQVNVLDCQPVHGLSSDCCRVVLGHCGTGGQLSLWEKMCLEQLYGKCLAKSTLKQ
ncbi:NTF2-related export protein 2 isoform X3 [Corvus hawaiiensis]|uniref:NTF2-related export protein 2 isoform X3 n=1 Tax=Corvus kubaryi TaxID=68294 RepID=UPI001C058672|nr:NTF2-related export protein 2 isoform X3 [Corvus kubaryi]XP_048174895.1 NTF2-related export protein 2 isoform X3 [Corvus hawaiiensis]